LLVYHFIYDPDVSIIIDGLVRGFIAHSAARPRLDVRSKAPLIWVTRGSSTVNYFLYGTNGH
jgi:hypothetical protein